MGNKQDGLVMANIINENGRIKLVESLEKFPLSSESKKKYPTDKTVKTSEVKMIEWGPLRSYLTPVTDAILSVNAHYFGFSLFTTSARENVNYNIYRTGKEYKYHVDSSSYSTNDMKLTCLLNISTEPYEGGEFQMRYGDEDRPVDFPAGSLLVFKPYIFHRVTPITKGIRRTLTLWMYGPRWQ